jgi:hypothetical protein
MTMGRSDLLNRDSTREPELDEPREETKHESSTTTVSVGRGPADGSSANSPERPERLAYDTAERTRDRRTPHHDRGRIYSLRSSEMAAMKDIGRFRTVDVRDLARSVYAGNERRLKYDLENLRRQGLVEEKTLFRAHKTSRRLVTLTAEGHRIARKASGLPKEQGFITASSSPRSSTTMPTFIGSIRKPPKRFARRAERQGK